MFLYLGVKDYDFDGNTDDIKNLVENMNFPKLKELQLLNSEMQDEITEIIIGSEILKKLAILGLGAGTLTDKGGEIILNNIDKLSHLKNWI